MTVRELIEKLEKMDQDMPVYYDPQGYGHQGHFIPIVDVWEERDEFDGMDEGPYGAILEY